MILVIGYGNSLRGDDGVGIHAATLLAQQWETRPLPEAVVVYPCHQLTPELAEPISRASLVLFIDAALGSGNPGRIMHQYITPHLSTSGAVTHHFDPPTLLAWAQHLYGSYPEAMLFSIEVASLEYNKGITPVVLAALPALLEQVNEIIARRQADVSPYSGST